MSNSYQHTTESQMSARPPAWFRYGIVAAATLILCSCRAVMPSEQFSGKAVGAQNVSSNVTPASFNTPTQENFRQPAAIPAIYRQDPHMAPPANRRAEYKAGIRPAACQCQSCNSCPNAACGVDPGAPHRDEYLCDGGDDGLAVAVRKDWKLDGLEQEDTIAHYDTLDGRTVVTPSNRVCIYAPRFGAVRRVVDLHQYARYDMPSGINDNMALAKIDDRENVTTTLAGLEPSIHRAEAPPSLLRERQQVGEIDRDLHIVELDGSLAPYADLQVIRAGTISSEEKVLVARASLAAITWTGDQSAQITIDRRAANAAVGQRQPGVVYQQKDLTKPRLRLIKLASTDSAKPGEEVEFTLRFDNIGSQVMGNVTLADNLTTRLEYIPGSAKSSIEADFTAEPNAKGSTVLRWEIKEPIEAGKGGVLQFRCKVL